MNTSLLPIPFKIHAIPKHYHKDPQTDALSNKADDNLQEWRDDIIGVKKYYREDECPVTLLDELDFLLEAGFQPSDSETTKRQKIRNAILSHKRRSTFNNGLKPLLDSITGFDAEIIDSVNESDWILTGDGNTPLNAFWGVVGVDDLSTDYGVLLNGGSIGIGQAGVVFIDLHQGIDTAQFTQVEIEAIAFQIADQIPAYEIIVLGYFDSSGSFIIYDGGIIQ